ncbi:MAG TPA: rhodanese-like domain-containing protein [Methylothermaceae bacterium]|nr:rhodanese-like domain-containing protein [Methylothermaceae bacterium]
MPMIKRLASALIMIFNVLILLSVEFTMAGEEKEQVNITKNVAKVQIKTSSSLVVIQRDQDTTHTIDPPFDKTSRPCPPFCIQPISISNEVKTLGELELITFMQAIPSDPEKMLIDARIPEWYQKETLPLAINVPWTEFEKKLGHILLEHFGAKKTKSGWNFSNAKHLVFFCNGIWSPRSAYVIRKLLAVNYPADKIQWYRGGMQAWKSLGLTTSKP